MAGQFIQPDIQMHVVVQVIVEWVHLAQRIVRKGRWPGHNMSSEQRKQMIQTLVACESAFVVMDGEKGLMDGEN